MILFLACTTPEVISGTLVDVRGPGLSGLRVVATSSKERCDVLTADVVDGVFTLPKPCRGEYALTVDDPAWTVLVEPGPLPPALALRAWPIPAAATEGAFLVGEDIVPVRPIGRVRGGRSLEVLPEPWPIADGWVVLVGGDLVDLDAALVPLVDTTVAGLPWKALGVAGDAVLGATCVSDTAAGRSISGCPVSAIAPLGDYAAVIGDRLAMFRLAPRAQ